MFIILLYNNSDNRPTFRLRGKKEKMQRTKNYGVGFNVTLSPSNENFVLHSHDNYEIYLFLAGDTSYVIDGKSYALSPGDVILIRQHQLHRAYFNSPAEYKRIVINVSPDFFPNYECPEYEEIFINESLKLGNKIPAELVKKSGLYDAMMRFAQYTDSFEKEICPVYVSCLMEIFYLLSGLTDFSEAETPDTHFTRIVEYINRHYDEDISLGFLSETFSLSRYHLCRMFKGKTGMTIQEYIHQKRFAKVRDYVKNGTSITEAALASGFESYSAFYRVYVKEFGMKPKDGLK